MIYGNTRFGGALVLSRKKGEKILIGDDIEIMVQKVVNGRAYISIIAPKHIAVDREEIRLAKRASMEGER